MPTMKCCICGNNRTKASVFAFPSKLEVKWQWMNAALRDEITPAMGICSEHFLPDSFSNHNSAHKRLRLKTGAVPTVRLPSVDDPVPNMSPRATVGRSSLDHIFNEPLLSSSSSSLCSSPDLADFSAESAPSSAPHSPSAPEAKELVTSQAPAPASENEPLNIKYMSTRDGRAMVYVAVSSQCHEKLQDIQRLMEMRTVEQTIALMADRFLDNQCEDENPKRKRTQSPVGAPPSAKASVPERRPQGGLASGRTEVGPEDPWEQLRTMAAEQQTTLTAALKGLLDSRQARADISENGEETEEVIEETCVDMEDDMGQIVIMNVRARGTSADSARHVSVRSSGGD